MNYVVADENIRELTARKSSASNNGNNAINNNLKNVILERSVKNLSPTRSKRICNCGTFTVRLDTPKFSENKFNSTKING